MRSEELAINGGQPVRARWLPYGRQTISNKDIAAVTEVLKSDMITQGPRVEQFEAAVADYCNSKYGIAFVNGTAALHAACIAAGLGPDTEAITTPLTFAATANCVLYEGGVPVFADVNPETLLIDPQSVACRITPRTKAVIGVDYAGQPCDYDALHSLMRYRRKQEIESF